MFLFIRATVISDFLLSLAKSRLARYSKTEGDVTQLTHLSVGCVELQWSSGVFNLPIIPTYFGMLVLIICVFFLLLVSPLQIMWFKID